MHTVRPSSLAPSKDSGSQEAVESPLSRRLQRTPPMPGSPRRAASTSCAVACTGIGVVVLPPSAKLKAPPSSPEDDSSTLADTAQDPRTASIGSTSPASVCVCTSNCSAASGEAAPPTSIRDERRCVFKSPRTSFKAAPLCRRTAARRWPTHAPADCGPASVITLGAGTP